MIRGFIFERSRRSKNMQYVIFHLCNIYIASFYLCSFLSQRPTFSVLYLCSFLSQRTTFSVLYLCSFLSQRTTFSVLYIYRNSKPLFHHLFVLILKKGKMAVNEPIFVI